MSITKLSHQLASQLRLEIESSAPRTEGEFESALERALAKIEHPEGRPFYEEEVRQLVGSDAVRPLLRESPGEPVLNVQQGMAEIDRWLGETTAWAAPDADLVAMLSNVPAIAELLSANDGGLVAHIEEIDKRLDAQWPHFSVEGMSLPGGAPPRAILRLAIALHDLGKPIDQLEQHRVTAPIAQRVLSALRVPEESASLILALIGHDVLGALAKCDRTEAPLGAQRALFQLREIAASADMGERLGDFLELQRLFFTIDATAHADIEAGAFETTDGGKLVLKKTGLDELDLLIARGGFGQYVAAEKEMVTLGADDAYDFSLPRVLRDPRGAVRLGVRNEFATKSGLRAEITELKRDDDGTLYLSGRAGRPNEGGVCTWDLDGRNRVFDLNNRNKALWSKHCRQLGGAVNRDPELDLVPPSFDDFDIPSDVDGRIEWAIAQWQDAEGAKAPALSVLVALGDSDTAKVVTAIRESKLRSLTPLFEKLGGDPAELSPDPSTYAPALRKRLESAEQVPRRLYHTIRPEYLDLWSTKLARSGPFDGTAARYTLLNWMGIADEMLGIWTGRDPFGWGGYKSNVETPVALTMKPGMRLFDPHSEAHQAVYRDWLAASGTSKHEPDDGFAIVHTVKGKRVTDRLLKVEGVPTELAFYREMGLAGYRGGRATMDDTGDYERPFVMLNPDAVEAVEFRPREP